MSPVPHASENFSDVLDPRFQRIYNDRLRQLADMLPEIYSFEPQNGRDEMKFSQIGTLTDWDEFEGEVSYGSVNQGFDSTLIPLEFTKGTQVRRKLFDDDQYQIMDQRPRGMATSYVRTRQKHGARLFVNSFASDTQFYVHSEGVALCSASHTTTSGASTAAGFDNLSVTAFSATAVETARIKMSKFRGDQAERIQVIPDELWIPVELEERAFEINESLGKVDTNANNRNFQQNRWIVKPWLYLTNVADWWMADGTQRQENAFWVDRVPSEFAMVEDFDTLVAKWRGYARYGYVWVDWRWVNGSNVA